MKLNPEAVKFIAVHCSASKPSMKVDASVIDRWHRARGFLKIGYHYVILPNGTIEEGRKLTEVGAHVEGHNSESIGICLVGGISEAGKSSDNFTSMQKLKLRLLIHDLLQKFPNATPQGHRDFPKVAKDCPCFDVKQWWNEKDKA